MAFCKSVNGVGVVITGKSGGDTETLPQLDSFKIFALGVGT